jgi:hypothetical protein
MPTKQFFAEDFFLAKKDSPKNGAAQMGGGLGTFGDYQSNFNKGDITDGEPENMLSFNVVAPKDTPNVTAGFVNTTSDLLMTRNRTESFSKF